MGGCKLQKFLTAQRLQTPLGSTTGHASSSRLTLAYIKSRPPNAKPELWDSFTALKCRNRVDRARVILKSCDDDAYVTREYDAGPINIHTDEETVQTAFEHASRARYVTFDADEHALELVLLNRSAHTEAEQAERALLQEFQVMAGSLVDAHTFNWLVPKVHPSPKRRH
ncbi:hypothetical protein AC1031_009489 [Aphanomyces cochlioides]|nr:hypothetical protein AC1031_009489 [Aphanomyces cochlioides]